MNLLCKVRNAVCDPDLTACAMFNLHCITPAAHKPTWEQVTLSFARRNAYADVHREIAVCIRKYLSQLFNTLILVCLIVHTHRGSCPAYLHRCAATSLADLLKGSRKAEFSALQMLRVIR